MTSPISPSPSLEGLCLVYDGKGRRTGTRQSGKPGVVWDDNMVLGFADQGCTTIYFNMIWMRRRSPLLHDVHLTFQEAILLISARL